jgi:hypothetical protein
MKKMFGLMSLIPILGIVVLFAPYVYFRLHYPSMSSWLRFNPKELGLNTSVVLGLFDYGFTLVKICLVWFVIGRLFRIKYNFTFHNALVLIATFVFYAIVRYLDFYRYYRVWLLD